MPKKQKPFTRSNIFSIPSQLSFNPPQFNFTKQHSHDKVENTELKTKNKSKNLDDIQNGNKQTYYNLVFENQNIQKDINFSAEDRENLKNAFRYICRLIFKEAPKYMQKIQEIAQQNGLDIKQKDEKKFKKLFEKAQQISGERYFRKYISSYEQSQQKTICQYMRWFLETKYLRYISEQGKGKRKNMKKHLYIKFKNQVMLPYLENLI